MAGDSAAKAWQGKMFARIDRYAATTAVTGKEIDIEGVVERNSLKIVHGSRDFKPIHLMNEGNIYAHDPEGMTEISFTMYTKHTDYVGDSSPEKIFFGSTATDNNETNVAPSHKIDDRVMCRLVILFTNEAVVAHAADAIGGLSGDKSKRYIFADCYITGMSSEKTDNIWKTDVSMKLAPSDADSKCNYTIQSIDADTAIDAFAALNDYDATNKW
jgi:hypothetical protein